MSRGRVIVTGGSGRLGKYVISALRQNQYEVTNFDLSSPVNAHHVDGVILHAGDILEIEDCRAAFKGADAVVHLAAIPTATTNEPAERIFKVNVLGTFNVLSAACELRVKKIVFVSSDASYGFNFRSSFEDILMPAYLPIDEQHPQEPKDPYGLSKKVGEEICFAFNRKYQTTIYILRISHVRIPEAAGKTGIETYRRNMAEKGFMLVPYVYNNKGDVHAHIFSYNDARDAAHAVCLSVMDQAIKGRCEVFCIGNLRDNPTRYSTEAFLQLLGFETIPRRKAIKDRQPLYDFSKAQRLLGYDSSYSWYELY